MCAQVSDVVQKAESLFVDLSGSAGEQWKRVRTDASALLDEIKAFRGDLFDDWSREMQARIDDPHNSISCVSCLHFDLKKRYFVTVPNRNVQAYEYICMHTDSRRADSSWSSVRAAADSQ